MAHTELDLRTATDQQIIDLEWDDLIRLPLEERNLAFERIMAIYEARKDEPETQDKGELLNSVAMVFQIKGQADTALGITEQATSIFERTLGPTDVITSNSRLSLAQTLSDLERYEEAQKILEKELDRSSELRGIANEQTIRILNQLGSLHFDTGNLTRALRIGKRVHDLSVNHLGQDHYQTLLAAHNLGVRLARVRQRKKALKILKRNHASCVRVLGPTHLLTITSLSGLAEVYRALRRRVQATRIMELVLELRTQTFGDEDPGTLLALNNLAQLLIMAGNRKRALDMMERAFRGSLKLRGTDHSSTRTFLSNLIMWTFVDGTQDQTEALANEVFGLYPEDDDMYEEAKWMLDYYLDGEE